MVHDQVIALYQRHAREFDRDRSRSLQERQWLDRFLDLVVADAPILDLGCGMGEPIGRYLVGQGFRVTGVDSSEAMIDFCRRRMPGMDWIVGDMRELDLKRQFGGVLAWDSFFHLKLDDQRRMFPRFAAHAPPGAPLMFTSGPEEGESIGEYHGDPLYHASLSQRETRALLADHGFEVEKFLADDPDCGGHTVWLASKK